MDNSDLEKNEEFQKSKNINYYEKDMNKYMGVSISSSDAIKNPKEYRRKIKEQYKNGNNDFNKEYLNQYLDQMNDLLKDVNNFNGK